MSSSRISGSNIAFASLSRPSSNIFKAARAACKTVVKIQGDNAASQIIYLCFLKQIAVAVAYIDMSPNQSCCDVLTDIIS